MKANLTEIDINKVSLTGNEKRFSDLRSNFYKTLAVAESHKIQGGFKDKRKSFTNFFRNLNKKQIEIPDSSLRHEEKKALYDMIIDDTLDDNALIHENKRQLVREVKSNFRNLENEISNVYNKDRLQTIFKKQKSQKKEKPIVPYDRESYAEMRRLEKQANPFKNYRREETDLNVVQEENDAVLSSMRQHQVKKMMKEGNFPGSQDEFELKKFANERIKMHIKNIQSKEYTLDDLDCFPDDINDIFRMKEFTNPIQQLKDPTPICENLRKNGLIEHSILKQNFFYLDESQDINFYKDMSSYSRRVFKDPK